MKSTVQEQWMIFVLILCLVIFTLIISSCKGNTGAPGPSTVGPRGPQGPAGSSVSFTESPATSLECSTGGVDIVLTSNTGVNTATVCNGANGATGAPGQTGQAGQNGLNAPAVTFIQFCSGFTAAYPGTFPEYAICVNNTVYGVYSANDGFLALLPPGVYSSDGINASCTFTIGPDCEVTP